MVMDYHCCVWFAIFLFLISDVTVSIQNLVSFARVLKYMAPYVDLVFYFLFYFIFLVLSCVSSNSTLNDRWKLDSIMLIWIFNALLGLDVVSIISFSQNIILSMLSLFLEPSNRDWCDLYNLEFYLHLISRCPTALLMFGFLLH